MTLFCVGDQDQLLYRFQGARPELLTGLNKWLPDIQTVKLETNYRSTNEIIAKSQQLISHNYSNLGGPYPQEFVKNSNGIKDQGKTISFAIYETAEREALEVANNINELLGFTSDCPRCSGSGLVDSETGSATTDQNTNCAMDCPECTSMYPQEYYPGDFFIGARTRAQLGYLEGALIRAQIPFINITGGSFWQSKHVADVIAYLRLAHNGNKDAFKRVNNIPSSKMTYAWNDKGGKFEFGDYCPARFLGVKFLAAINYDVEKIDSVYRAGRKGWQPQPEHGRKRSLTDGQQDLISFIDDLKWSIKSSTHIDLVIQFIVNNCYEKYLKYQGAGDDDLNNAKLEDLITVEEIASRYTSVDKFLSYVDEMIEAAEKAKNKDWGDYVVLSTIHRLKGLERPIVFGLGWCEGVDNQSGRDVGLLPHTFSLSPPPDFGVLPGGEMSPIEDERCIAFVCISRAIERVYLSGIKNYRSWNMGPSRFIYEMELVDNE